MINKKRLISSLVLGVSLFSCVAANASVYSKKFTGTNSTSNNLYLGKGDFTFGGECTTGSGTANVMKIRVYAPDRPVATLSLTNPQSGSSTFKAVETNDKGDDQSYYIRWKGKSSSATANLWIDN